MHARAGAYDAEHSNGVCVGDAKAQFNLGLVYAKGEGVTQNRAKAFKWYRAAAEQGYAGAQFGLGLAYVLGDGVTQNSAEAAKWFRAAAEQGHTEAQDALKLLE
ncbi:MAG: tetratricopeptide repeat protein [Rhodospirillales bacterium]